MLQAEQMAKLILENSRDHVSQKCHYFLPCGILYPVIFLDDIQKKGGEKDTMFQMFTALLSTAIKAGKLPNWRF